MALKQQVQTPNCMRIKEEEEEEETTIPVKCKQIELPDHMCDNVLLNLSGKSLLRFKCVSKQWHSLISSHRFNRDYLHYNRNNPTIYSLIIRTYRFRDLIDTADLLESMRKFAGPKYPVCRVLMMDYDSIERSAEEEHQEQNQVVSVPSYRCYPQPEAKNSSVYVMTLKSNLWRKIYTDFPYVVPDSGQAVSADGNLYWFAQLPKTGENFVLISFDLGKEKFRQVPMPPNIDEDGRKGLGLLGGCISLATYNRSCNNCFDIWLFKEDTWIKFVSFPLNLHGPGRLKRLRPLFINKDGALVMHALILFDDRKFDRGLIYDPKEGTCKKYETFNLRWNQVIIWTKSLVSFSS